VPSSDRRAFHYGDTMDTRDYQAEEINRKHWDEVAPVHGRSYDLESLLNGGHHLDAVQVSELGNISGKKLLHLQCHIGTDTLSLARLGAEVTGIDISGESLKVALELAGKTGLQARFIQTPLLDLPLKLNETFDIVYTSIGVLCWVSDIEKWAGIVSRYLKPGGTFYLMESHPFLNVFDDEIRGLHVKHPYFTNGRPIDWPGNWPDYSDGNYIVKNPTREFLWTISDVHNSLVNAGLTIEYIHEFNFIHWKALESMEKCDDGFWRLPEHLNKIPILFSLKARRN
jgi:ubiquinone/menaquinone biosynthesis C-methylase UbiE